MFSRAKWTTAMAVSLAMTFASWGAFAAEYGGRAMGMGGAYTGIANDVSALVYNPSGLAETRFDLTLGLNASSNGALDRIQDFLEDPTAIPSDLSLSIGLLSGASIGSYGVGIAASGTAQTKDDCGVGIEFCAEGEYMTEMIFGAGYNASRLPFDLGGMQAGLSVKRLNGRQVEFSRSGVVGGVVEETVVDWQGKGLSATVGGAFYVTPMIKIGVAAQDVLSTVKWEGSETVTEKNAVTQVPVGPETKTQLASRTEALTPVYRAGISIQPPLIGAVFAADIGSDGVLRYGLEKRLLLGLAQARAGQIIGDGQTTTTLGVGMSLGPLHLDAAFDSTDAFSTFSAALEGSIRF